MLASYVVNVVSVHFTPHIQLYTTICPILSLKVDQDCSLSSDNIPLPLTPCPIHTQVKDPLCVESYLLRHTELCPGERAISQ